MAGPQYSQGPQRGQEPGQQPPPQITPWGRRHRMLWGGGVGVLVVVLIAGLTVWLRWPEPEQNRGPFDEAVANLAAARGVHYSTSPFGGMMKWDVTATATGEAIGSITFAEQTFDVLRVGKKTYLRTSNSSVPNVAVEAPASALSDKWVTGDPALFDPMLAQFMPPPTLAGHIREALSHTTGFPAIDHAGIVVNGVPALKAETPAGPLYVSKEAPYRVLRYTLGSNSAPAVPALPGLPDLPSNPAPPAPPVLPGMPGVPPTPQFAGSPPADPDQDPTPLPGPAGLGEIDLSALSPPQLNETYNNLQGNTRQLTNAVDTSIQFTLQGSGNVNCGPVGCSVQQTFTGRLSGNRVRVTGGQVSATLTAAFTINGMPAGACASPPGTFAISGAAVTGHLSCRSAEAGAVFTRVDAQMRAMAQARSRAAGGAPVPYSFPYQAQTAVLANALAQVEVRELVDRLKREQRVYDCSATPNSFPAGTPVLLADGTARPIEQIRPGTMLLTSDPTTGQSTNEPVLARIVGNGKRSLDQLTVTDDQHPGTITTTRNHLFWDTERRVWIEAGELRPGNRLASDAGTEVSVSAVHPITRTLTVYNLTVPRFHTYYVVADSIALLVHNDNCGTRIRYNSDTLSNAAFEARNGAGIPPGRNVAVARVPGWNDPKTGDLVYGFSKGNKYHSEEDIRVQLAARGYSMKQVAELYSERQPCPTCESMLRKELRETATVTWSVPWGDPNTRLGRMINGQSQQDLEDMIRRAWGHS